MPVSVLRIISSEFILHTKRPSSLQSTRQSVCRALISRPRPSNSCLSNAWRIDHTYKSYQQVRAMKLRRNELCPIHRSSFCCGRERLRTNRKLSAPVRRIVDPHHPRGYRELRSPSEMRKLLNRKIVSQNMKCAICKREFTDCEKIVPDHIEPRGLGGGKRDDHADNIQAVHRRCNFRKGSKRGER